MMVNPFRMQCMKFPDRKCMKIAKTSPQQRLRAQQADGHHHSAACSIHTGYGAHKKAVIELLNAQTLHASNSSHDAAHTRRSRAQQCSCHTRMACQTSQPLIVSIRQLFSRHELLLDLRESIDCPINILFCMCSGDLCTYARLAFGHHGI